MGRTQDVGNYGEKRAAHYLRMHGYTVKERNWRSDHMEIDVIASTLRDLVFVEVKTRTYTEDALDSAAPPKTAVDAEKQRLTRRAANRYLLEHPTRKRPRMDVIEVYLTEKNGKKKVRRINHIKAAY